MVIPISVSAICTYSLSLDEQLAFWQRHEIKRVGISVAKLEAYGWEAGVELVRRGIDAGHFSVGNVIGLGPFLLDNPELWDRQRERVIRSLVAANTFEATTVVLTTGPARTLSWEEAADAFDTAMRPVLGEAALRRIRFAIEHTHALRVDVGFVHSLHDAIDLAIRLDADVCMEINACWAERGLYTTLRDHISRIGLVQISDFAIGTLATPDRLVPGDGDIPLQRILSTLLDSGYLGDIDIEIIGPQIEAEGYDRAIPRAILATEALLTSVSR